MGSGQLELDWRADDVVEARCGCATSGREVCTSCGCCTAPVGLELAAGCCRCLRPASSASSPVRKGCGSRTALADALLDTLASWHASGREVRR